MSNTASKKHLDKYLATLETIVKELVPEPFNVARIESRVSQTWELLCDHAELRDKLWWHLENILMSDLDTAIKMGYLEKFYERYIRYYNSFHSVYTNKTINKHHSTGKLYTSSQGYDNVAAALGMIQNDRHILVLFNENYKLPFPAPPMDWAEVVLTNLASPEYKELFNTLIRLKPEWDKLTEYKSKLDFWFKNGLSIDHYSYFLTEDSEKKDLPENRITIYPFQNEDIPIWKRFYYDNFNKYNFNTLETSKAKYRGYIEQGADPIPLTKKIIDQIDKDYAQHDRIKQFEFRMYCTGYNASQNGQINDFLNNGYVPNSPMQMREFCTGVVHEKYERFLKDQLAELENQNKKQEIQTVKSMPEIKDYNFVYFLRQYIDRAVRWEIAPTTMMTFESNVRNSRGEWEKFKQQFRHDKRTLAEVEKSNFYDELTSDFYPMIDLYLDFYHKNLDNIKDAVNMPYPVGYNPNTVQHNPYSVLFDLCTDTKKEIEVLNTKKPVVNPSIENIANHTEQVSPIKAVTDIPTLNFTECLKYINSVDDFAVNTEVGRDEGKGLSDFIALSKGVDFTNINAGFDEVWEIGMKIKKENENLSIYVKPVSIREVLKRFLMECKTQSEVTSSDFIKWLDSTEFKWRKFQKESIERIIDELKKANSERTKKLELARKRYVLLCGHHHKLIELIREDILNNTISQTTIPSRKRKDIKLVSYKWQSNPEKELPVLYKEMIGGLIHNETTLEQFISVFTGQSIENITPIKWLAAKNLLAYFLDLMRTNSKVPISTELWAIAKKCFEGANNLSQSRDLYLKGKSEKPKNSELIEALF